MSSSFLSELTGLPVGTPTKSTKNPETSVASKLSGLTGLPVAFQKSKAGFDALDTQSMSIDLTNVYPDPIEKYAKYNVPLNPFVDWNETRAQNQGTGQKWVNGITKALITAGGAFAENTIGVIAGLGNMMFGNGSFYDNAVGRGVDSMNEWAQTELPNYYTQEEQYGSVMSNLGSANFWADKVANGAGYTLGSIASMFVGTGEAALVGRMGNIGKLGQVMTKVDDVGSLISPSRNAMYKVAKGINNGDKAADVGKVLQNYARGSKIKSAAQHFTIGTQMSLAEASVEARETKKRYIEEEVAKWEEENPGMEMPLEMMDQIVSDGNSAGNTAFGINMAVLVPTNLMMFGKAIFGIQNKIAPAFNKVKNVGTKGAPKWIEDIPDAATAKFFNKSYRLLQPIAKNMALESSQEAAQFAGSEFAIKYQATDDLAESITSGLSKTFGTKEGLESILIGAIVGGGSGTLSRMFGAEKKLEKAKTENTAKLINLLNTDVMGNLISNMSDSKSNLDDVAKMKEALGKNDKSTAEIYRNRIINRETARYRELGAMDYFYERLEDAKGLPEAEFIKSFGYDETRTIKEQTGKTQTELVDDVINKAKLNSKRLEQVQDILQSYTPSNDLISKLLNASGSTETKLAKQMGTQLRREAAKVLAMNFSDIDTLDASINDTYDRLVKAGEDIPSLQRITSLITPDIVFAIKTGELEIDTAKGTIKLNPSTLNIVTDKKLIDQVEDINKSLLVTNPADAMLFGQIFSELRSDISKRSRLVSYTGLLTSSNEELENFILDQFKAQEVEDKANADKEADTIIENAQTSEELEQYFPQLASSEKKAAAREKRKELLEKENKLVEEYSNMSEEDFNSLNEEELPEPEKLAYRRALRKREETKAKTISVTGLEVATPEGETADFITEMTDMQSRAFGEVTISKDGGSFIINGRRYQNFEEDSIDAIVEDEDGNIVGVKLLDSATGNFVTFKKIDPADPAYNEQSEFENAVVEALSYIIYLQDNALRENQTQTLEEAKEQNAIKAEAALQDSVKILEFEKTEGDKVGNAPSAVVDGIIDSTQKVSGLSDADLRSQIEVLRAEIAEANEILDIEWQIAKEAGFTKAEFDKDQMVKDIKKIRKAYRQAMTYRINILKQRKAQAKAEKADLTQGQIPVEIEQTPLEVEAAQITKSVDAEIEKLKNEEAELVSQIDTYTNLIRLPDFSPGPEFYAGIKEAQSKLAIVREKIAKRNNLIDNINAEKLEGRSDQSETAEGAQTETQEQDATGTDFAPATAIETTQTEGISKEEAEAINKKNAEIARVSMPATPASQNQNLEAQQSVNSVPVVVLQGNLDIQLSPVESKTIGRGEATKRLVSPTGKQSPGNRVGQTVNGVDIEVFPAVLTSPELSDNFQVEFEVRTDTDFEFTDWTDVPIFVVTTDPTTGERVRVGILQAYNPSNPVNIGKSRQDIFNLAQQGLTPIANASKLFGSKNIANSRTSAGDIFFYPVSSMMSDNTVALAYVGQTRLEGVRVVPTVSLVEGYDASTLEGLSGEFTPGQIIAVVLNPEGVPVPIPLSTRDVNEQVVNTAISLIQSEDATDHVKIFDLIGFNVIPTAALPDDMVGTIEEDGVMQMVKNDVEFSMAYLTRAGNTVFTFFSPTANSYISINRAELVKALNGQIPSFSFVVAEENEKGIDLKTVAKDPAAYKISGEVIAEEFKSMLSKKKMQVSKERLASNTSFTSPITGIEYQTYIDYLSSETELIDDREDGVGSRAILGTDTPVVNKYGSVYYNLGLKVNNISTIEKPVEVEEDLQAKAVATVVEPFNAAVTTPAPVTPAPVSTDAKPKVVKVYHHTNVAPQDFDFGSFQRGKQQVSQFGDGLNASSTTTPFLVQRYGDPIEGEIDDSNFVVIDANKSEKELYEELKAKGYKFNNPDTGSYIGNDPAKEYDGAEKANVQPAIISLFNDFQKSNPQVKGVKVINHIIGNQKVDPFYVIYDAKSFYGPGSLSKTQSSVSTDAKADIERRRKLSKIVDLDTGISDDDIGVTRPEPGVRVTYYLPEGKTTDGRDISKIPSGSIEKYTTETRVFYGFEEAEQQAKEWIKSKYDAELAALGQPAASVQPTTTIGPETKINIYAGTGENAELSNFAFRPFIASAAGLTEKEWPAQGKFNTVEGAYQAQKIAYTSKATEEENKFNLELLAKLRTASGAKAKSLGRQIKSVDTKDWDKDSSIVMENLLIESFDQNPDALAKLLATGNATLTHTQDKGKWGTEFPKLLMKVREELRGANPAPQVPATTQPTATIVAQPTSSDSIVGVDALDDLDEFFSTDSTVIPAITQPVATPAVENTTSKPTTNATANPLNMPSKFDRFMDPAYIAQGEAEMQRAMGDIINDMPNPDDIQDLGDMVRRECDL
jgi:predicted NAD-dependent protein-ADP-ribosyltransferase YbiA (DUF1768 family)